MTRGGWAGWRRRPRVRGRGCARAARGRRAALAAALERGDGRFGPVAGAQACGRPTRCFRRGEPWPAGVADDVEFRDAVQTFRFTRPREPVSQFAQLTARNGADRRLAAGDGPTATRGAAPPPPTCAGALALEEARLGSASGPPLRRAAGHFRHAVELDATNQDAQFNLELALRLLASAGPARAAAAGARLDAGVGRRAPQRPAAATEGGISFLSPWAAAVGAAALAGVVVLVASERRSRRLCGILGLGHRPTWSLGSTPARSSPSAACSGLAASQPVVSRTRSRTAAPTPRRSPSSTSRARCRRSRAPPRRRGSSGRESLAKEVRSALAEVPVGVSSLTDRLLPHLFPTLSATAFTSTVDRAVDIERPPPERRAERATSLGALADLGRQNYFGRRVRGRVAVVLTDGESIPFTLAELRAPLVSGRVTPYFVHVWHEDDRVYSSRGQVERYRPDPRSRAVLERIANDLGGGVFTESQIGALLAAVKGQLGSGPVAERGRELRAVPLAPYAAAAAALPLAFLLLRRNF